MKKDYIRDYATECFRAYAGAGYPTYEEAYARIYDAALKKYSASDAELAVQKAEEDAEKHTPYLLDIMAADKTFELLEKGNKHNIVAAVKAVYCSHPYLPLSRGDISSRVLAFAHKSYADERTVYRWLKEARLLCAAVRGLSISDDDMKRYSIHVDDVSNALKT